MNEANRQLGILPMLAEAWNKHGLCEAVSADTLAEAISQKQEELSLQNGCEVSEITVVAALLSDSGMAEEARREFIGNCYGVIFPPGFV